MWQEEKKNFYIYFGSKRRNEATNRADLVCVRIKCADDTEISKR